MKTTIPLETQYSAIIQQARVLFDLVLSVKHKDGVIDPETIIEKVEQIRTQQKVIMLGITRLRGDSVTALRKKYGPRTERLLTRKVDA